MDKTSEEVTKDPKRVEASRKDREKYMNKSTENILNDVKKGSRDTSNSSNETTSTTDNANNEITSVTNTVTARSNDTYVYGIGVIAVVPIGVCVFFAYNTFQSKKIVNEKHDQPPKRRHSL